MADDTCHSHARPLESVPVAAGSHLSPGVVCDRPGLSEGGVAPPEFSVKSKPPSTAVPEVDASGDTRGLLDAAIPINRSQISLL